MAHSDAKNGNTVDLGIFWEWEYDRDFVLLLDKRCQDAGLSSYMVHPWNLDETRDRILTGDLSFRHVLDRASDVHEGFFSLIPLLNEMGTAYVNPPKKIPDAIDKSVMHTRLMEAGLDVPYSILLDSFNDEPFTRVDPADLKQIGTPFIIKPAQGGGGDGVVLGARMYCDIVKARAESCGDRYLVQEEIVPDTYRGRRAWFRVFYVGGRVIPCWWDDRTKLFEEMTKKDAAALAPLGEISEKIAGVCGLNFFSSEIAKRNGGNYVVVDYVNDICDMRIGSRHRDGVPDRVVHTIIDTLIKWVRDSPAMAAQ